MDLGSAVLAINEAAGLTSSDVMATLRAALRDAMEALATTDQEYTPYAYVCAVIGTDEAGSLVYETGGRCYQCAYTITQKGTKRTATLAISKAIEVWPRTVFDTKGETVLESPRRTPKNPAVKDGEIQISMESELCSALAESAEPAQPINALIKIIGPGQGASCFYPAEVLKRDGPKVFTKGTHMYYNHPTANEEAQRPEGDLRELAAVTTGNAYYDAAGPKGEGLYAPATIFSDFAPKIRERAPHIGTSIRAYGEAKTVDGKLTLQSFSKAESVDFVTRPGAKGAVLTEAARSANHTQENTMEKQEVQALIEAAVTPINAKLTLVETENAALKLSNATLATQAAGLKETANRSEARLFIAEALKKEELPGQAKVRVLDSVLALALPVTEAGALDTTKLGATITAEVKKEADYIAAISGNSTGVRGMNPGVAAAEVDDKAFKEGMVQIGMARGMSKEEAERYAEGRN